MLKRFSRSEIKGQGHDQTVQTECCNDGGFDGVASGQMNLQDRKLTDWKVTDSNLADWEIDCKLLNYMDIGCYSYINV